MHPRPSSSLPPPLTASPPHLPTFPRSHLLTFPRRARRRAATRDTILAGAAVLILILAIGLYFWLGRPDQPPADEFIGFHCPKCPHDFQVSQRDFEQLWDGREFRRSPTGELLFRCPKCNDFTATRADPVPSAPPSPPASP